MKIRTNCGQITLSKIDETRKSFLEKKTTKKNNKKTFLPSIIKIFQRVFDLQRGHKINGLSLSNITKGDNAKSKKGSVVILVRNKSSCPVLHFYQVPSKYSKEYLSCRADRKSFSNITKGDNSKSKKNRVVNLVCNTSSHPDLHFYQISSKYSKGYSHYRADKKFYADADANGICPKNNMSPPTFGRVWGGGVLICLLTIIN